MCHVELLPIQHQFTVFFSSLIVGFDQYLLPTICTGCLRSVLFAFVLYLFAFVLYCLPFILYCFLRSVIFAFKLYWFPSFCTGCLLYVYLFPSFCTGFLRSVLFAFYIYVYLFPSFCTGFLRSVLVAFVLCCLEFHRCLRSVLVAFVLYCLPFILYLFPSFCNFCPKYSYSWFQPSSLSRLEFPSFCTGFLRSVLVAIVLCWLS